MRRGFTLIELLVVVLIIGILSSIALPQYTNAVEKARLSEALSMIGSLKTGIDAYVLANGSDEYVDFVGKSNVALNVTLDVDAEASLDCPAGKTFCYSKHFSYNAICDGGLCYIYAYRQTLEEYDNGSDEKYELLAQKEAYGWDYYCYSNSKVGNHICKSLQSQGWTVTLYSE